MPDRLEGRLRWLFGVVAVVLVATGACALLAALRAEPAQSGVATAGVAAGAAPAAALIAPALAAGTIVVLAVALLVAWGPRRFTHLMPLLALAPLAAGVAFALAVPGALRTAGSVRTPLAGLLGSLALAALAGLGWLRLWLSQHPGNATAARDAASLDALLGTLVPRDGTDLPGVADPVLRGNVERAFAARAARGWPLLRAVLRVLDACAAVKHRTTFARLDVAAREALLAGLATSRSATLRELRATLDRVVLSAYYGDARVQQAIGYDAEWIARRIEAGPNAEAHRLRREAEEEARRLAEVGSPPDVAAAPAEEAGAAPEVAPAETAASTPAAPEKSAPAEEGPFDRPWTLGVPSEPVPRASLGHVLRVARSSGPTRP